MNNRTEVTFTGIIPARYASSRFPGKPLAMIGNKSMIERVFTQASMVLTEVYVATDDERIYNAVTAFGGKVVMTSPQHRSGTDRCAEASSLIFNDRMNDDAIVFNIQGDEPFIMPEQLTALKECFSDPSVEIATLVREVGPEEDLFNPNHPKVVLSKMMDAMFFSRSVIPYVRDSEKNEWIKKHRFYKHIGLYGYRASTLSKITLLPQSSLEIAESLEQNRWLENGYKIRAAITPWESIGIDTPEDLEKAKRLIQDRSL